MTPPTTSETWKEKQACLHFLLETDALHQEKLTGISIGVISTAFYGLSGIIPFISIFIVVCLFP